MEIKKIIEERRSAHSYDTEKEVSDEQLRQLFDLVKMSPSGYNLQPWEFIVVRGKEQKKKLSVCAYGQPHIVAASAAIIVLGNSDPSAHAERVMEDRVSKGYMDNERKNQVLENLRGWSQRPREWRDVWTTRSTSLAAMTLMLAAYDMGLATCPMEGFEPDKVKEAFGIPEQYTPVMLITIGYKKEEEPQRSVRRGFGEIVHLEEFGKHPE